ncbi:MAG: hypothetical protein GYB68_02375 [Chloroflexi bacterium]|nr:hypothetical protein [Chloroflexota bacterium]
MTKINDYLWHLPHEPLDDDPPDIALLADWFNEPVIQMVSGPLADLGYQLSGNDVAIRLLESTDFAMDTFHANVRFIRYLAPEIMVRVHFEHDTWGHYLPTKGLHRFFISLDRFKFQDLNTQMMEPGWHGRLHLRMSYLPDGDLEHDGEDQIWHYSSLGELTDHLHVFLDKFQRMGQPWLEDPSTM